MSYLVNALKQSQQQSKSEQDYVQARQSAQVAFYKRLSLGLGGGLISVCALSAGYFLGQSVQAPEEALQAEVTKVVEDDKSPATEQPATTKAAENVEKTEATPDAKVALAATPAVVPAMPVASQVQQPVLMQRPVVQGMVNNQINYQWMSVQVGFDASGRAVYSQQLVPVNSQGQIINVPVQSQVPQVQRYATAGQFSQPNMAYPQQSMVAANNGQMYNPNMAQQYTNNPQANQFNGTQNVQEDELSGVSDELKQAFAAAVEETRPAFTVNSGEEEDVVSSSKDTAHATPVELLPPKLQNSIPSLRYQAHIYATEPEKRWIKLNNRELYEGDNLGALTIVEITPEQALFDFDGIEFTLNAMQDWIP
ncbi:general secretion pathway protein GspB [Pseudoalteromonas obscura]|uniref:General secretion pathway protein GspB n=1 Tax=Pseudoalteromonas obscura TaxID=3048491 RepID=A0ABT7EKY2_9GAMM|nr:general secretion pathway protein GspB [Pseudoalteromonas sp. P94(2023)]MDK2595688.1 general secretion pathway protein GspB [Pseudoalteromonas sp. P94(2023)]